MRGMGIKKIVVNAKVRALLLELDGVMNELHRISALLAPQSEIPFSEAVNLSAEKESLKNRIVGVAYRLNEACIASEKGHKK